MLWREARPANDFAAVATTLEEVVGLVRHIAEAKAEAPLGGTGVQRVEIGGAPLRNAKLVESIVDDSSVDEGADAAEHRDDEMDPLTGARVKAPIGAGEEVHTAEGLEGIDEDVAEDELLSEDDARAELYKWFNVEFNEKDTIKMTEKEIETVQVIITTSDGKYFVFDKKSELANSFRQKFAEAVKEGKPYFYWKDKKYSTNIK